LKSFMLALAILAPCGLLTQMFPNVDISGVTEAYIDIDSAKTGSKF
jgi:hypothetical protein